MRLSWAGPTLQTESEHIRCVFHGPARLSKPSPARNSSSPSPSLPSFTLAAAAAVAAVFSHPCRLRSFPRPRRRRVRLRTNRKRKREASFGCFTFSSLRLFAASQLCLFARWAPSFLWLYYLGSARRVIWMLRLMLLLNHLVTCN